MNDRAEKVLKPCPFCGGEARVCWGGDGIEDTLVAVNCYSCDSQGESIFSDGTDEPPEEIKQQAIAAWNRRALDATALIQAKRGGVEMLRDALLEGPWTWNQDDQVIEIATKLIQELEETND